MKKLQKMCYCNRDVSYYVVRKNQRVVSVNISWCNRKWVFFNQVVFTPNNYLRLKQRHENHCNCLEDVAHNYYIKTCDPENLTLWKQPCEILLLLRLGEILSTQSSVLSRFNLQSQDRNMAASNSKRKYWFISVLSYSQPKETSQLYQKCLQCLIAAVMS